MIESPDYKEEPIAPSNKFDFGIMRRRRFFRFSVRTFLSLFTVVAICLAVIVNNANTQRKAVERVLELGGDIEYELAIGNVSLELPLRVLRRTRAFVAKTQTPQKPPGPAWMRRVLGHHYFFRVAYVSLPWSHDSVVTDADLEEISKLSTLRRLDVHSKKVTDAGLAHIARLQNLEVLDLSGTCIQGDGFRYLAGCSKLERLVLSGTSITDSSINHLRNLPVLKHVAFSSTDITDAGIQNLASLSKLQSLDIAGTNVTGKAFAELRSLKNLQFINGNKSAINDGAIPHLVRFTGLRRLNLDLTPITSEGLAALKSSLPNCKVSASGHWGIQQP